MVQEVFNQLQALKITSNEDSVHRWLRRGKLKGYQQSKKQGWRVTEADFQHFINQRVPYLLDAFLYDSNRIKMDKHYELLEEEEKVLFALIEYLRL